MDNLQKKNLIETMRAAVTKHIKKDNDKPVKIPVYYGISFASTVEGCTIWNKHPELYDKIARIFADLPEQDKRALSFEPDNGMYCERCIFWKIVLDGKLDRKEINRAMQCFIAKYIYIKQYKAKELELVKWSNSIANRQ